MATTGTYLFDPQLAEVYDEAFEIAGIDPSNVGERHLESAARSMKMMLNSEWSNVGIRRWMIQQATQAMSPGLANFRLPAGALDVLGMVFRRDSRDTEMYPISRQDYLVIVDKTLRGRADRYYVDRQAGNFNTTLSNKLVYIWQCGDNSTDIIVYDYFRQIQDVGNMQSTQQIPSNAIYAMTMGLASKLCLKFLPEKFDGVMVLYRGDRWKQPGAPIGGALGELIMEDRERSDIELSADFTGRRSQY